MSKLGSVIARAAEYSNHPWMLNGLTVVQLQDHESYQGPEKMARYSG